MFEYSCVIERVVDGDTVDVSIDLGFHIWLRNQRVRLLGIDTAETNSRDGAEREHANMAKARVQELLPVGSRAVVRTELDGEDKYGRILGVFWADSLPGISVNDLLVQEHLAVPYQAQNKKEMREAHEEARRAYYLVHSI